MNKKLVKKIYLPLKHIFIAIIVFPLVFVFWVLPFDVASFLIGSLVKFLGQFHYTNNVARNNLINCFPEKSSAEIDIILQKSWENLGRTMGEMLKTTSLSTASINKKCEFKNLELIDELKKKSGVIFVSAHFGNWELASRILLEKTPDTALIYRRANNPYIEKFVTRLRKAYVKFIIAKGDKGGMKEIIKHLKKGGSFGMLADQKLRSGEVVSFFGLKTFAPTTPAELAVKFNLPIVFGRAVRDVNNPTKFIVEVDGPIYHNNRTSVEITQEIYNKFEDWIKQNPEQWFWQHRRWDSFEKL